jgi:hypothetical protein
MKHWGLAVLVGALAVGACAEDMTGPSASELALAREAQLLVEQDVANSHGNYVGWLFRLLDTLRTTDDPEARAFLEQARAYHDSGRVARLAGRFEAARHYHELAFRSVLSAVIEIFPNAPDRAGALVDSAVARIERRLGDREAPRIRRILAHVKELRARAEAQDDPVTELAIDLRAIQILHRLVFHLRIADRDHDGIADREMQDTPV